MMRRLNMLLVSASFLVLSGAPAAAMPEGGWAQPGEGVPHSYHDMNVISGARPDDQGRVCAFCHTPHHAMDDPAGEQQPLWSHEYTCYTTDWKPYASPTLDATITDPLMGPSRLCMSCHDGVVAIDQHYGTAGTKTGLYGDGWGGRDIGLKNTAGDADFSNDHPIGFSYTAAQGKDRALRPADSPFLGNTNANLKIEDVLLNGEFMTCSTCHDVHNRDNARNTLAWGRNYFVYAPQDGSQLCLSCHDK